MDNSDDSVGWIRRALPSSSHSYGISKALSAKLDAFDRNFNSPHLSLLQRMLQVISRREVPEVYFGPGEEFGIALGEGATYIVEKKRWATSERKMWVAAKRAKVVVPKQCTAGLIANDEIYRRLQAVLLEVEILTHPKIRQHPNIAPLIGYTWDATASGYAPILVMELAPFGDGRSFLSSTKLSDEERVSLCKDIASGLEALHACSIVHGDVKLENVLVYSGSTTRFVAKITDLERSPQSGDYNMFRGTRIYNAPEVQSAHLSGQGFWTSSTELWLCDVFSFGLLSLELLTNIHWYGQIPGGEVLMDQVLSGAVDDELSILNTALGALEMWPGISPAIKSLCCEILQHTLLPVSTRLRQGWSSIRILLGGDREDKIEEIFATELDLIPALDSETPYSIMGLNWSLQLSKESLGSSMWSELEWTALHDPQPQRRGKAAFELFVVYGLAKYSPDISLPDALDYLKLAALSGYDAAFIVGKRVYSANELPIPQVFQLGPKDARLRQQIESLERYPNENYYSNAVRIFWSQDIGKIASEFVSKLCPDHNEHSEMTFMEWLLETQKQMDAAAFSEFASHGFLLHQAVLMKSYMAVDLLLLLDLDINAQIPNGLTPLHLSCRLADSAMIQKLLENGANPSVASSDNTVPLHWLVLLGTNEIRPVAEALLKAGAAAIQTYSSTLRFDDLGLEINGDPFAWACYCLNHNVIEVLLDLGVNPLQDDSDIAMAYIQITLGMVCPSLTEVLLRCNDLYNNPKSEEKEKLFCAIGMGHSNDFQRWLVHGSCYVTAFTHIIESLSRCFVDLPLKPRSTVQETSHFTPLSRAALSFNIPLTRELLRLGANVNELDHQTGESALDLAIRCSELVGSPEKTYKLVELLLQYGASTAPVDKVPGRGGYPSPSAIFLACSTFASAGLIRLLAAASPSEVNHKCGGNTPLYRAANTSDEDSLSKIQSLVESGADPQIEDEHRDMSMGCCQTALAASIFRLNWPISEYLLESGSSIEFGITGAHKQSLLHLLIYKCFILESRNRAGEIAGLLSIVRDLLNHSMAREKDLLNTLNFRGISPMRMAVFYGLPRLLKVFFNKTYGSCTDLEDIQEGRISLEEYVNESIKRVGGERIEFIVPDTAGINDEECMIEGDKYPYVETATFRTRLEDVVELIKTQSMTSSKQPLPLKSF